MRPRVNSTWQMSYSVIHGEENLSKWVSHIIQTPAQADIRVKTKRARYDEARMSKFTERGTYCNNKNY